MTGVVLVFVGAAGLGYKFTFLFNQPNAVAQSTLQPTQTAGSDAAGPTLNQRVPPGALNEAWIGTWRGSSPDARIVIAKTELMFTGKLVQDGKSSSYENRCKWTTKSQDELAIDGPCLFGYGKRSKSQAEIHREFEKSVAHFKMNPIDFRISDPVQSLEQLAQSGLVTIGWSGPIQAGIAVSTNTWWTAIDRKSVV